MYGTSMGTLNVWAGDRSQEKKVWTLSGNQGDAWTSAQVDVPTSDDLVVNIYHVLVHFNSKPN